MSWEVVLTKMKSSVAYEMDCEVGAYGVNILPSPETEHAEVSVLPEVEYSEGKSVL